MIKRRPTLNLADWKVATHLEASRSVQNDRGYAAHECSCEWCELWRRRWADVLPSKIQNELQRIGIDPADPVDLYADRSSEDEDSLRIVFCLVGKIVSGPDAWIRDEKLGYLRNYRVLRSEPYLSLVIHRHEDLHYYPPVSFDPNDGHYLLADFRLAVPRLSSVVPH